MSWIRKSLIAAVVLVPGVALAAGPVTELLSACGCGCGACPL